MINNTTATPILLTNNNQKINLRDIYKNSSSFLILSGPSFGKILSSNKYIELDNNLKLSYKEALSYPSHITMGVNNSVKSFRPNLWTAVDDPNRFLKSIWLDPTIQKFIPYENMNKNIFDSILWKETDIQVSQCPNVFGLERNEKFDHHRFLAETTFNWGDHKNYGGSRSVMLIAIKLLYYLGIREIFLLGCDFHMDSNYTYHFNQERSPQALKNNNKTYGRMIDRFEKLKPIFDSVGFKIYNCNKDSGLEVFDYIDFEDAIRRSYKKFGTNIISERVEGLYDREAKLRKGAQLIQPGIKK